jgi:hypothetical protein
LTGLDRVLGETCTRNDTLLRTVHANAESPSVIVFMKHANELTGVKIEFIRHRRLEVKLNTVNIVRTRARRRTGSSTSDRKGTSRGGTGGRRQTFDRSWSGWDASRVGAGCWWSWKLSGRSLRGRGRN